MGYTIIAPVGDNPKALFIGIKEFPTDKVIFLTPTENYKEAERLSSKLDEFTIKSEIIELKGNMMEDMFRNFGRLVDIHPNDQLIVNVATGDRLSTCAALSAAFANGLKAFGVMGDKTMLMPIMKLSYYRELSDNKLKILKELNADEHISLQNLAKNLNMSISLLSYHLNGNYKYKGLKEFRLVELKEESKNVHVKLSSMGNMLLRGYIQKKQPE